MPLPELRPDDVAACRALLRHNSRTFHAASMLLPARVRAPASVLYGFCRLADDAIDVHGGRAGAIAALSARLDRAYAADDGPRAPEGQAVGRVPAGRAIARPCVGRSVDAGSGRRSADAAGPGSRAVDRAADDRADDRAPGGAADDRVPGGAADDRAPGGAADDRVPGGAAVDHAPGGAAVDRALRAVFACHDIPRLLPERLVEGLAWDAEGRRYPTLEALLDYAARVAGTVGAMMALLMGARSSQALARACDLGVAMQLSNIARDVGDDARNGRVYLPLDWLRDAGIDVDTFLADPRPSAALAGVVHRLLQQADVLYARAGAGVALLPLDCRPGIQAARLLYAAIGHQVLRNGSDPVTRRAVVAAPRKALLLLRALASPWPSAAAAAVSPLAATRQLVEAAARSQAPPSAIGFVIDLFERLERRDRLEYR